MTTIHTGNARRQAQARKALGRGVLQSWECLVDDYDRRTVHLRMRDLTVDRGDQEEYGSFPRRLFSRIPLVPGLILIVEVLKCRQISIRTVPRDPNEPDQTKELLELLKVLRFEDDARDGDTRTDAMEGKEVMKDGRCGLCGRTLKVDEDPMSRDCGGDCWGCVGQIEADAGCAESLERVTAEMASGERPTV